MQSHDIVIIGGGTAGLSAALQARKSGISDIVIIERENELGGVLNRYIHNGFTCDDSKEKITGPEYAYKFIKNINEHEINYKLNTTVLSMTKDKVITAVNDADGLFEINAKAVILASGACEKRKEILEMPMNKAAGIYTAEAVQKFINFHGCMPGKNVIVYGSNDSGLIVSRRITLEGSHVAAVIEKMPYLRGHKENLSECLDDFNIPLLLGYTIKEIKGKNRVEQVTLSKVDKYGNILEGCDISYDCDTIVLSMGLIPENNISKKAGIIMSSSGGPRVDEKLETNIDGVFACGNAVYVHDEVKEVKDDGCIAGRNAAFYVKGVRNNKIKNINIVSGAGIKYSSPNIINIENIDQHANIALRPDNLYKNVYLSVYFDDKKVMNNYKDLLKPGKLEIIRIPQILINKYANLKNITLKIDKL